VESIRALSAISVIDFFWTSRFRAAVRRSAEIAVEAADLAAIYGGIP
jgi:hypothetical protein